MQAFPSGEFSNQWKHPTDILSVLLILGGDVVARALAQLTGPSFVPICFSFGWVSYAFSTISSLLGDGRLMPPADYPCKVINLENGYTRTNRSWIVGRLLRDLEQPLSNEALRVDVYEAVEPPYKGCLAGDKSMLFGGGAILIQMGIASIPFACSRDWGIFMITVFGTCAALATAGLPQWRVEKLACRIGSKKKIAITTGNGSRHVIVILGEGNCLDIEDLAAGEGPRHVRPWGIGMPKEVKLIRGLPLPFWLTRLFYGVLILAWAALLISVMALTKNAWYLVAVGTVGMAQNVIAAAASRDSETRGIYLKRKPMTFIGKKVMDVLMDLESWEPGCGRSLLKEFFPAGLDVPVDRGEKEWWDQRRKDRERGQGTSQTGSQKSYDEDRYDESNSGIRYDNQEVEEGMPSRGTRWGRRRRGANT
ncbi:hypothetical protein F5883DRAFT_409812 [Diaporthe sp. PMI_573]|nr:hypothetical protein F5883DRAFT_409812 [Diaporthaceae sp. PMI_573]